MSKGIKGMLSKVLVMVLAITPMSVRAETGEGEFIPPSSWAMETLVDAEAYGVLPVDFMSGLQSPVTEDSLKYILDGVHFKVEALGPPKASEPQVRATSKELTRETVLIRLYNELLNFDFSGKLTTDDEVPLAWMEMRGIVKGNGKGLSLEEDCTLEEAVTFATRLIEELYVMSDQGAKGLIWEVTNGSNKVYLLGTVHMGQSILYPIHESLDQAFLESDTIAFEVDFNNQADMQYLMEQQMFTDGTTLKDHVSEEIYTKTVKLVEPLGLTDEQVKFYKPMTLTNIITVLSAREEATNELPLPILDIYFQTKTRVLDKELVELEGIRYQTDFLYNAPMDTQILMLESTISEIGKNEEDNQTSGNAINEWLKLWAAGDEEDFAKSFPKNEKTGIPNIDDFNEELFDKRDKNMTDKVVQMLNNEEGKTYMVIVGAGHMTGKTGIVSALQALGYNVTTYNK